MPSAETNFSSSPVSHQDVEDALQRIEMVTNIYAKGGVAATIEQDDTSRLMPYSTKELMDNNTLHVVATSDAVLTSAESKHDEPTDTNMPTSTVHTAENSVTIVSTNGNFECSLTTSGTANLCATPPLPVLQPPSLPRTPTPINMLLQNADNNNNQLDGVAAAPADELASHHDALGVASLFTTPPQPVLQPPAPQRALAPTPAPRQHRRLTFDMSSVRRSARLSTRRPMTQMQQAQRNLCRKLGLYNDEPEPIEAALHEFIGMFNGPLPLDVSDALNEMFNLNDDGAEAMDNALIGMVGEGIDELLEVVAHEVV